MADTPASPLLNGLPAICAWLRDQTGLPVSRQLVRVLVAFANLPVLSSWGSFSTAYASPDRLTAWLASHGPRLRHTLTPGRVRARTLPPLTTAERSRLSYTQERGLRTVLPIPKPQGPAPRVPYHLRYAWRQKIGWLPPRERMARTKPLPPSLPAKKARKVG